MKNILPAAYLCTIIFLFSSCSAIAGIFKAGVWVGVLIVVAVIALIIFLVTRGAGKQ